MTNNPRRMGIEEMKFLSERNIDAYRIKQALRWISTINSQAQQSHLRSLKAKGTGQWFLDAPEFKQWVKKPGQPLFCPGIPGAGKTMMVSGVVDHLETLVSASETDFNLAYIYCDYKTGNLRSNAEILGEMVRQLVQRNDQLAGPLLLLYDDHMERKTYPKARRTVRCAEVNLRYVCLYRIGRVSGSHEC